MGERVVGGGRILHATGLAATAGLDLRLHHHRLADLLGDRLRLFRGGRHPAGGGGNVVLGEQLFRLVLEKIHQLAVSWSHCLFDFWFAPDGLGGTLSTRAAAHRHRLPLMWQISPRVDGDTGHNRRWNSLSVATNIGIWLTSTGLDNVLVTTEKDISGWRGIVRSELLTEWRRTLATGGSIPKPPKSPTSFLSMSSATSTDLEFRDNSAFDRECQVIHAPELDDMHDTDDLIPMRLAVPSEVPAGAARRTTLNFLARRSTHAYRDSRTDVSDGDRGHRHHRHERPSRRPAPQGDRQRGQGPADDRGDGRRRHRGGRALGDEQLRHRDHRHRARRRSVDHRGRRHHRLHRRHADRDRRVGRRCHRCTPRRSPRPPHSPRSGPSARPGCSARCS